MAGDGHFHAVKTDPAIERWSTMHNSMYQRFRLTPQRTRQVIIWAFTVPVLTYQLMKWSDDRWDLRAKGKNDSILRKTPAPQPAQEE